LGARYVLEGSVRRIGGRVRIAAQLIDAMTGAHRWGERYDLELELQDVFAVQDEVARAIVAILAAHVNRAERERALLKPPAAWEAYEYYLRSAALWLHMFGDLFGNPNYMFRHTARVIKFPERRSEIAKMRSEIQAVSRSAWRAN
jgi:hypothetical protein